MYTQVEVIDTWVLPPLIPPFQGGKQENLVPSPMHRGGLGWGNSITCVYTVAKEASQEHWLSQTLQQNRLTDCYSTIYHFLIIQ
ncbi:hypothetical protein F8S20_06175 [Nostoc sp. BAE]|nr:hypothetical protein [Nostoc commune BAE]